MRAAGCYPRASRQALSAFILIQGPIRRRAAKSGKFHDSYLAAENLVGFLIVNPFIWKTRRGQYSENLQYERPVL